MTDTLDREAFDISEVAIKMGVSTRTVYRWRERGHIHTVVIGNKLRVPADEVDRLLGRGPRRRR